MKKLDQKGFHVIEVVIVIVVLAAIGFIGYKVFGSKKTNPSQTTNNQASTQSGESNNPTPSEELIWQQIDGGWRAMQTAPECPNPLNLKVPVELSKVTSILYPGQTRGGNYKPHGGFRLDGTANDKVTVTAPIDGFIVRGGQYLAEGEIQYTFDVMNNCGIMYRVGHLRAIPDNLMALTKAWPEAKDGDSRTQSVNPAVFVKQGEVLATSVGIIKDSNTFFDWGVYDYRQENKASKSATYQKAHATDKDLSWHALCWFDLLSPENEAKVRSLPAGDPTSGKNSDYCK